MVDNCHVRPVCAAWTVVLGLGVGFCGFGVCHGRLPDGRLSDGRLSCRFTGSCAPPLRARRSFCLDVGRLRTREEGWDGCWGGEGDVRGANRMVNEGVAGVMRLRGGELGFVGNRVRELLRGNMLPSELEVKDESALHVDHQQIKKLGGVAKESHLSVMIVSSKFDNLTQLARHKLVNDILAPVFEQGLHALRLTTLTPLEKRHRHQITPHPQTHDLNHVGGRRGGRGGDDLPVLQEIRKVLESAIRFCSLNITEINDMGDDLLDENDAKIIRIQAASIRFRGLSRMKAQHLVYELLDPLITKGAIRGVDMQLRAASNQEANITNTPNSLQERIEILIHHGRPIVLFIKGTPDAPMCGFSRQAVELMERHGFPIGTYDYVDIFHQDNQQLRQGMKEYSNWPTFPQLYVDGTFLGGLDVMKALGAGGELSKVLLKRHHLDHRP